MNSTLPTVIETSRLILRSYREGDEHWYFEMSQRNRAHLEKYEPDNPALEIKTEEDAKKTIAYFVNAWKKRTQFFIGVFLKESEQFVAQIYVGSVNQSVPEFGIGYIADVDHEGWSTATRNLVNVGHSLDVYLTSPVGPYIL